MSVGDYDPYSGRFINQATRSSTLMNNSYGKINVAAADAPQVFYSDIPQIDTAIKSLLRQYDGSTLENLFVRELATKLSKIQAIKRENEYEARGYKKALEEESLAIIEKLFLVMNSMVSHIQEQTQENRKLYEQAYRY